ncbi:MAG: D-alanyl-D-alanine carboxypeptidase family protein [Archangiaceae bacterium]|nr:D-alanyl-D-alanine carboxypeptidase family protein [Archangiaceae bacterium]
MTVAAAHGSSSSSLRFGAHSSNVRHLQQMLRAAGIDAGPIDGHFGPKTLHGLKAYQRSRGLQVDGVAGPKTWRALNHHAPAVHHGSGDGFTPAGGKHVHAYIHGHPKTITVVPVGNGKYLRADAAKAFLKMQKAARAAGVHLSVVSGFRTMEQQKYLYNLYLHHHGNLAAKPGYSNHQNGIAVDIGGIGGRGTKADRWLRHHAAQFGFKNLPSEFWHYNFVG